jgi:UPF0755 protein
VAARRTSRRARKRAQLLRRALFAAVLASLLVVITLFTPYGSGGKAVKISAGMSVLDIGAELAAKNAVMNRWVFALAARISGAAPRLQPGVYRFPHGMSAFVIARHIADGRYIVEYRVTIPEGSTLRQIAGILRRRIGIDSVQFLKACTSRALLRELGITASTAEGYLMPDTYMIRPDTSPEAIIRRLHSTLRASITDDLRTRMRERRQSLHEVLTMASLVDGETSLPEERARVAGVYYNRLRRGMMLQADPTVQYIIADGPRRLFYRDLRIDSPYNTYRVHGLPPGPVNNPGRAAIRAALYPENHSYLYFVATGRGGHTFTRTGAEHLRAVAEYRRQRDGAAR